MITTAVILTSCLKLLLIPSYYSTDFEVHRNWLAITHSLPLKKWYYEDTSQWTLDYPPLFAWFEFLLSMVAKYFDPEMLKVERLNYTSDATILFQRLSVIVTDVVYAIGAHMVCKNLQKGWRKDVVLPILLITNCGLVMVDHIHFQYNGVMYGILLISIAYMMQSNHLLSAFWFTVLLNMKHIYIYLAPAYFVYLLRHYCLKGPNLNMSWSTIKSLVKLGSVVLGVFAFTFLPFYDQIPQIFSRLFPFKRGLCHAYWAPNFWALYNVADKVGFAAASFVTPEIRTNSTAAMTGGLVQEFSHSLLPNISPFATMSLTTLFFIPAMVKLYRLNKQPVHFLRCMVLCALTSFMFGWHVHEKAVLMAIVPISILSIMESTDAKIFLVLSTVAHYSLHPLLFPPSLLPVKALLLVLFTLYSFHSVHNMYPFAICKYRLPLLNVFESVYLLGLTGVFFYENFLHSLLGLDKRWPFLPLMVTSVYCAVGVAYCWGSYYLYFLRFSENVKGNKKGN